MPKPRKDEIIEQFEDYVGVLSDKSMHTIHDYSKSSQGLDIVIDASHTGVLNSNIRFYAPSYVKAGIDSFINPYRVPLIKNHDTELDPLGRVRAAEYVDYTKEYKDKGLSKLVARTGSLRRSDALLRANNDLFQFLDNEGFFESYGRGFKGLGVARTIVSVTDGEAIEKLEDERFDTVSVSFSHSGAYCLECDAMMDDEGCEHGFFDSNPTMPISHRYREISFVNVPADILAGVKRADDSVSIDYLDVELVASDSESETNQIILIPRIGEDMPKNKKDKIEEEIPSVDDADGAEETPEEAPASDEASDNNDAEEQGTQEDSEDTEGSEDSSEEDAADDASEEGSEEDGSEEGSEDSEEGADEGTSEDESSEEESAEDSEDEPTEDNRPNIYAVLSQDKYIAALDALADSNEDFAEAKLTEEEMENISDADCAGPAGSFIIKRSIHIGAALAILDSVKGTGVDVIRSKIEEKKADFSEEDTSSDSEGKTNQELFDSLYEECADSNPKVQELKSELMIIKFDAQAFSKEANTAETKYAELFDKVKPMIAKYVIDKMIEVGQADHDDSDDLISSMVEDEDDLIAKFDIYSKIEDNKDDKDKESDEEESEVVSEDSSEDTTDHSEKDKIDNDGDFDLINYLRQTLDPKEAAEVIKSLRTSENEF